MIFECYNPTIYTAYVTLEIPREFLKSPERLLWISEEKIV